MRTKKTREGKDKGTFRSRVENRGGSKVLGMPSFPINTAGATLLHWSRIYPTQFVVNAEVLVNSNTSRISY